MKEQKISLETSKLAKSKGFDEYCQSWFEVDGSIHYIDELEDCPTDQIKYGTLTKKYSDTIYLRPTQSLLQKWLREVHNIEVYIAPSIVTPSNEDREYYCSCHKKYHGDRLVFTSKTYESAFELGLGSALESIETIDEIN